LEKSVSQVAVIERPIFHYRRQTCGPSMWPAILKMPAPAGSRGAPLTFPKRARAASARKHRLHCARNVRLAAGSDVALLSQQGRYLSKRTLLIAQFLR
jgi:hypothetical protein